MQILKLCTQFDKESAVGADDSDYTRYAKSVDSGMNLISKLRPVAPMFKAEATW